MLRWFLISLAVVLVLFFGIGMFLSSQWTARTERFVKASPQEVRDVLLDGEGWQTWWPAWTQPGATDAMTFAALDGGGSGLRWSYEDGGSGVLTLEPTVAGGVRVIAVLDGVTESSDVALTATDDGTTIVWSTGGDVGANPLRRWVSGTGRMEEAAEASLRRALDALAARVTAGAK